MDSKYIENLLNQKVFGVKLSHLGIVVMIGAAASSVSLRVLHRLSIEKQMDEAWNLVEKRRIAEMESAKK